jgi:hypothetical protein
MAKIIRYEVGNDYEPGDRFQDGTEVDLPIFGIDAIYDTDPGRPGQQTGPFRHTLAITVSTTDEDRRICLQALNGRLDLDVAARRLT